MTCFRPYSDLKRHVSGPKQVEIRSKSGPNQVQGRAVRGRRGWSSGKGPVAPPGSLDVESSKIAVQKDLQRVGATSACISRLDGRHRAIVIAESLARVIAAIRITSVRWRSYLPPPKTQKLVLIGPAFVALRFESRDWRSLV